MRACARARAHARVCACARGCVRARVRACVRACVRARVQVAHLELLEERLGLVAPNVYMPAAQAQPTRCACVRVCVRVCVCVCASACVRACVRAHASHEPYSPGVP